MWIPHDSQPDREPDIPPSTTSQTSSQNAQPITTQNQAQTGDTTEATDGIQVPLPSDSDDDLLCEGLTCQDVDSESLECLSPDEAWYCSIAINDDDIQAWKSEEQPTEMAFLVSAAKRQKSEVKLSTLSAKEKAEFQEAKHAEVRNWINTGTISRILRDKVPPDQVLRCRWVLTWKPIDNPEQTSKTHKAKARLVILGYLDPQLTEIPRDSPTLGRNAKMLLLQLIASMGWDLRSFDVKAAFLQGKPQAHRVLAIEPVDEMIQQLQLATNEICKLEKGAYGLVDAPYQWFQAIREALLKLGFEQSPFDACLFILRDPRTSNPDGAIGLHVDDGLCGGNERFLTKLRLLEKQFPFGSHKLKNFTFTGIEMNQGADKTIHLSQSHYVRAIEPIVISRERRAQEQEAVTETERHSLRALVGSLQYAAVHTRPDLAARLSMLQSQVNSATVNTLIMDNQALHEGKRYHEVTIQIQPIHPSSLRFLGFSDASFASKGNPNSHSGSIIMSTHESIKDNVTCPVNPISWGCKKIQRVVTSTLAAETVSLNTTLDQLSWIRLCWAWILDPRVPWRKPEQALKQLPETYTTATLRAQQLPENFAATDCKSLFDLVSRTAMPSCSELRTQITAMSIKEMLSENISLRWVHSGAQLADCLTKIMQTSFLRDTLRLGKYKLHDELQILRNRASSRNRLKWLRSSTDNSEDSHPNPCNNEHCFLNIDFLGM